jgi:Fe-S cluster assembly iron-binding protein IscA
MLQVTQEATAVLMEARSRSGAPPEAGLRIQTQRSEDSTKVVLNFQKEPEPTDQTIETPELRVFVASELVEPLSNRVLDVSASHGQPELMFR